MEVEVAKKGWASLSNTAKGLIIGGGIIMIVVTAWFVFFNPSVKL